MGVEEVLGETEREIMSWSLRLAKGMYWLGDEGDGCLLYIEVLH